MDTWIWADYAATALFTLKPATATSSGGKTLLIPTPFAIKMALLDVVCRVEGRAAGEAVWPTMRDWGVAIRPAQRVVVNNTFTKILKPRRNPAQPGTSDIGPLGRTIGYREYAYLDGDFGIALGISGAVDLERVAAWLISIQSLGKRGSFVQVRQLPDWGETLPDGYIVLDGKLPETMSLNSILQQVDDAGPKMRFDHADIYSETPIRLGTHRILHSVLLPYTVRSSSRGYTYYTHAGLER
jgi:hypothetical protein